MIEITGKPNHWHVHLHITAYAFYYPVRELSRDWNKSGGGFIVDIREVPTAAVIGYVTKYVSKTSVDPAHSGRLSRALANYRLFQPFGYWTRTKVPKPDTKYCCPNCGKAAFMTLEGMIFGSVTIGAGFQHATAPPVIAFADEPLLMVGDYI